MLPCAALSVRAGLGLDQSSYGRLERLWLPTEQLAKQWRDGGSLSRANSLERGRPERRPTAGSVRQAFLNLRLSGILFYRDLADVDLFADQLAQDLDRLGKG